MTLLTHFLLECSGLKHQMACGSGHTLVISLKTNIFFLVSASFVLGESKCFLCLFPSFPIIVVVFQICFVFDFYRSLKFK